MNATAKSKEKEKQIQGAFNPWHGADEEADKAKYSQLGSKVKST